MMLATMYRYSKNVSTYSWGGEIFDFREASARETKRALKNMNDDAIVRCNVTLLNNIRQMSKVRLTLCCAGAIHDGDFERFLERFEGHVVCTKLDKDKESNEQQLRPEVMDERVWTAPDYVK